MNRMLFALAFAGAQIAGYGGAHAQERKALETTGWEAQGEDLARASVEACFKKDYGSTAQRELACFQTPYDACEKELGGSTYGMSQCFDKLRAAWEERITVELGKAQVFLPPANLADLNAAHDAWLTWDEKACKLALVQYGDGSITRVVYPSCRLRHRMDWATTLNQMTSAAMRDAEFREEQKQREPR